MELFQHPLIVSILVLLYTIPIAAYFGYRKQLKKQRELNDVLVQNLRNLRDTLHEVQRMYDLLKILNTTNQKVL